MKDNMITSLLNPIVKHLVQLRQDNDYRHEQQLVLIDGLKPLLEITPWITRIIVSNPDLLTHFKIQDALIVTEAVMKKISGMSSPEGIVAEVKMPPLASLNGKKQIIALDGINDPGNLGTLLRTALALGWEGVFLLPNCCDPYNEKVLRSARGAQFRLPLARGTALDLKNLAQKNHLTCFVADLDGIKPEDISKEKGTVLVLGNEARGASVEILNFCTKVTIPMPGSMESLNVAIAGGILMYELRKNK